MSRPGVEVEFVDIPVPRNAPTDTGVAYVVGLTERGPTDEPVFCESFAQVTSKVGARTSVSALLIDSLETAFREGLSKCYIGRVVGDDALAAQNDFAGATAATMRVSAVDQGEWGNDLNVQVTVDGATFGVVVTRNGVTDALETETGFATVADAVDWSENSDWVRISDLGTDATNPVAAAATGLTGGVDDRAAADVSNVEAALALFDPELGPGQVAAPGYTDATTHTAVLAHANGNNRVAVLDAPDSASEATLKASAASLRSLATARKGSLWAPWAIIPGLVPATTRVVPYSAVQLGLIARSDGAGNSPNIAAAGHNGLAAYAIGLKYQWTAADREELNDAGVNLARVKQSQVLTYGYRTLADPVTVSNWVEFTHARMAMAIAAQGGVVGDRFTFDQIDGQGLKFAEFKGQLVGVLLGFYEQGSIYGQTPEEAFRVDTGPQVNTIETIAARELHARVSARMSPFAELVHIEIIKTPLSEVV